MLKAVSVDLRARFMATVWAEETDREAGERFAVTPASVSRWGREDLKEANLVPRLLAVTRFWLHRSLPWFRAGGIRSHSF